MSFAFEIAAVVTSHYRYFFLFFFFRELLYSMQFSRCSFFRSH